MIQSQVLVDYEKFRSARVALFVDVAEPKRSWRLLEEYGGEIDRLARLFNARVFLAEEQRLASELIVEMELADAWLMLVANGDKRAMATKNNPQRVNPEGGGDWLGYAFRELIRQIKESTRIQEQVTGYYSRLVEPRQAEARTLASDAN